MQLRGHLTGQLPRRHVQPTFRTLPVIADRVATPPFHPSGPDPRIRLLAFHSRYRFRAIAVPTVPAGDQRGSTRTPELDGVRGLAILLVVAGHAAGTSHAPSVGVTLFFALSGYLITGLIVREIERTGRIGLRAFWARRARRIVPALALFLGFLLVLYAALGTPLEGMRLAALAPVMDYHQALGHEDPITQHRWSLAVEQQFYLVWPVLAVLLWRTRRPALWLWLLAGTFAAWRIVLLTVGHGAWAYYSLDGSAFALLFGCLAAVATWRPRAWVAWAALAALSVVTLAPVPLGTAIALLIPAAAGGALLVASAHLLPWLAWTPLRLAGRVSYAWYLWHVPLIVLVQDSPALRWGAVVMSLVFAVLSWRLVESRFLPSAASVDPAGTETGRRAVARKGRGGHPAFDESGAATGSTRASPATSAVSDSLSGGGSSP